MRPEALSSLLSPPSPVEVHVRLHPNNQAKSFSLTVIRSSSLAYRPKERYVGLFGLDGGFAQSSNLVSGNYFMDRSLFADFSNLKRRVIDKVDFLCIKGIGHELLRTQLI